jgi:hypothetical protein
MKKLVAWENKVQRLLGKLQQVGFSGRQFSTNTNFSNQNDYFAKLNKKSALPAKNKFNRNNHYLRKPASLSENLISFD